MLTSINNYLCQHFVIPNYFNLRIWQAFISKICNYICVFVSAWNLDNILLIFAGQHCINRHCLFLFLILLVLEQRFWRIYFYVSNFTKHLSYLAMSPNMYISFFPHLQHKRSKMLSFWTNLDWFQRYVTFSWNCCFQECFYI